MSPVEQLTALGPGGVAVLAVRGAQSCARLADLVDGTLPAGGRLVLRRLVRGEQGLDEALLLGLGPQSFELHLHASPPLVREVMELLEAEQGESAAQPAPAAGLEARAARALEVAPCEGAARLLLDQSGGALTRALKALLEGSEESLAPALAALVLKGQRVARALNPATVVLAGPVNAGKSTLFNVLVGEGRVIVSSEEGTTRDLIRMRILLGGWPLDLVDSAGERELSGQRPADMLERQGQRLARELRRVADLVLWLTPHATGAVAGAFDGRVPECSRTLLVTVATCADRLGGGASEWPAGSLSALSAPEHAREVVLEVLARHLGLGGPIWSAGEAVPFEPWQVALALEAAATADHKHRRALLETWLAGEAPVKEGAE